MSEFARGNELTRAAELLNHAILIAAGNEGAWETGLLSVGETGIERPSRRCRFAGFQLDIADCEGVPNLHELTGLTGPFFYAELNEARHRLLDGSPCIAAYVSGSRQPGEDIAAHLYRGGWEERLLSLPTA
jgi:hypothetical protein